MPRRFSSLRATPRSVASVRLAAILAGASVRQITRLPVAHVEEVPAALPEEAVASFTRDAAERRACRISARRRGPAAVSASRLQGHAPAGAGHTVDNPASHPLEGDGACLRPREGRVLDNDLTRQNEGEPLGERIVVADASSTATEGRRANCQPQNALRPPLLLSA